MSDFELPAEWTGPLAHAVFDQGTMLLAAVDADLRIVATNASAEHFPRTPMGRGDDMRAVFTALGLDHLVSALEGALSPVVPALRWWQLLTARAANGKPLHLGLGILRVERVAGRTLGLLVTMNDTTELVRAESRFDVVREAARSIGASLDVAETAQQLADLVVPRLADLAAVHLAETVLLGEEPGVDPTSGYTPEVRAGVAHTSEAWPAALAQVGERLPAPPDIPEIRAMESGATLLIPRLAVLPADAVDASVVPESAHSLLAVPLFARGHVLGSVQLWRTDRREPFDEGDARLLEEIASRAALSVDNARRYTRERSLALALQRSLLPEEGADEPAAETFAAYVPTSSSAGIGGDWYDMIPLSSLRLAFVLGDVAGHGLQASATMGRLRTAVQALADMDLPPDELLTHVDDLVQRFPNRSGAAADVAGATCLYAEYDPVTSRCRIASAGHPPPAVLGPDGRARFVELEAGPPLGVGGMPFEIAEIDLAPGSVLVLYSDGLISGSDHDLAAGMRRLLDRLEHCDLGRRDLGKVGRELLDAEAGARDDDTTLLLARVRPLPDRDSVLWELPADPEQVARARELTAAQLAAWDLDHLVFTTELVVSELVTNAIRYGEHGPVAVRLVRGRDVLICEVSDPSNTQPRLRRARSTDEGGRGLFLVAQLTRRWGSRYQQSGKTIWAEQETSPATDVWDLD
ncbi:ATP-binding SpoIIE family protein phosphatase [Embleya scabrispora]|uniref:ATP-binding SpoIIE family protein phosphatase n=1 Tax=Embleya scabrispora TaxID=159449 RepID=UPI00037F18EA|nr:SpoIIE family protein phosphatase [Embleya scabrispora]MYS86067.1 SpoIIE family protein phosphatase [Streptomyces sp. SID5474]